MEKKKFFKNRVQMILYSFIFCICMILFIVIGKIDFQKDIDTEAKKFHALYNMVPNENLYAFANSTDVLEILKGKSGVILMGFPTNVWTNYYAKILNDAGIELDLDKIYYYDFKTDREESNGTYETIVNELKGYVPVFDDGSQDIQAPTVVVVKSGEILAYFDDTSISHGNITPDVYYTENQKGLIYEQFKTAITNYLSR